MSQQLVNNPISNEALDLINFYDEDESRKPTNKVFAGFNDSLTQGTQEPPEQKLSDHRHLFLCYLGLFPSKRIQK